MARLLHIIASPRGERSRSLRLAQAFLESYRRAHPDDTVETLDVFHDDIPEFDEKAAAGKYRITHGAQSTTEEDRRWLQVVEACEHFKSFGKYVLTCPMWNFSIPYRLKLYLDTIVQPSLTFAYDPQTGYSGLVGDKPVMVLSARGGDYSPGSGAEAIDFHAPYLKWILGFMGLTNVDFVLADGLDASAPEEAERILAAAIEKARQAAQRF